jgi:hypothetical protein
MILKIIFRTEFEHNPAKILIGFLCFLTEILIRLVFFSTSLDYLFLHSSVHDPGKIEENSFKINKHEIEQNTE